MAYEQILFEKKGCFADAASIWEHKEAVRAFLEKRPTRFHE